MGRRQLSSSCLIWSPSGAGHSTVRSWRLGCLADAWLLAECLRFHHVGFGDDEMLDAGTQSLARSIQRASTQDLNRYQDPAMASTSKAGPHPRCSSHPTGRFTLPTRWFLKYYWLPPQLRCCLPTRGHRLSSVWEDVRIWDASFLLISRRYVEP